MGTKEDIFHIGILSPALQKKGEGDPFLPQQQGTSPRLQPMRDRHNLELLFFSSKGLFKTTLPNFLLKPNKSKPASFVLQTGLRLTIAGRS